MRIFQTLSLLAVLAGISSPAIAQEAEPPAVETNAAASDERLLDAVVVSGRVNGPGLWKVSKGGHVMWVLGTTSPLPRGIDWDTRELEEKIGQSQEWIQAPGATFSPKGGVVGGLLLLPAALKVRKNPEGKRLQEVIPASDYTRWQRLKTQYLPKDDDTEEWRPYFAGQALYQAALAKHGLGGSRVGKTVADLAKRQRLRVTDPLERMKVEGARKLLRELNTTAVDDLACMRAYMDLAEHDMAGLIRRANAWSVGDTATLAAESKAMQGDTSACTDITRGSFGKRLGVDVAIERSRARWLAAVDTAMARNASTLATLPVGEITRSNGLIAQLRTRGYTVEAPDAQ